MENAIRCFWALLVRRQSGKKLRVNVSEQKKCTTTLLHSKPFNVIIILQGDKEKATSLKASKVAFDETLNRIFKVVS